MSVWDGLAERLSLEEKQCAEEGRDVTGVREKIAACGQQPDKLNALWAELERLPAVADYPYVEPDGQDWAELAALADGFGQADAGFRGNESELSDRLYGAWLGRCAGCALGKPFETYPFVGGRDGLAGWEIIRQYLVGADAFPLDGYVPGASRSPDKVAPYCSASFRENIRFMETDDDVRYLVLGLLLGEEKGNDFTPDDVAWLWQTHLPARMCYTAELQAYLNSLNCELADPAARWRYCATYRNPYREWIGAQIRVDHYAYANAGSPRLAARVAWQDARFSHVKNGVYGAMFTAAVIAEAFNGSSPEECVRIGLSVVPRTSRLYEAVAYAVRLAKSAPSAEVLWAGLWEKFGHYHTVHTINNAACCAASVVYGNGDFTKTLSNAVCCGWDTDCNGATVGSFLGALLGAKALPARWVNPLHDTLYAGLPDFHPASISDCARRSLAVYRKLHA